MNLAAYDIIGNKIDKTKSWLSVNKSIIYSREIKPTRGYYTFANRYNKDSNDYSWYVILINEKLDSNVSFKVIVDDYGRTKINIKPILKDSPFRFIDKDCNITIKKVEEDNDGDIYQFIF